MDVNETHIIQDMRLPFIFHIYQTKGPKIPPPRNWHENIELLYVTEGYGTIQYHEESIDVQAGDVVVVNANIPHAEIVRSPVYSSACLIIDRGFCLANNMDTSELYFTPHIRDPRLSQAMDAVIAEYQDPDSPYQISAIRSAVLQILVTLCREYSAPATVTSGQPNLLSCIQKAIGYIRLEYAQDLSLDDVAARVGLSKYYFSREFRRVTGYSFVSYVNIVRCEEAKRLLSQTDRNVGEIGRACGFPNPSYFTRTFCAHTGSRPKAYREKKAAQAKKL